MFTQQRVGKKNAIFTLLKFKTLTNACDDNGVLKEDYLRVTAVGQILRKTSLDELPQLINVIKGDMSLIGPRPLLIKYLPFYNAEESKRHNVKPGLSGLAQISGRNELDWNSRLRLDVQYVENISFKLDFFIFFKTIGRILSAKDVITNKPYTISDLDHERKIL
ncbi:MAG: sugar transferase [Mucilaginibacter sp.]|nr:sugar transferase [Mucilaginibacter sp.]